MDKIPFSLDIPKMGYFILVRNKGGFFGNGIQEEQLKRGYPLFQAQYEHVGVSGGGQWLVDVAPPKAKVTDLIKGYKGRYICIVRYKDSVYEQSKRYKVAFWAASNCNLDYDYFGVLRFKFKFLFGLRTSWFCSENSLWALKKEFPLALNKRPEDCMPADFLNSQYFEIVWEGVLDDF